MKRTVGALVVMTIAMSACSQEAVELNYRYAGGDEHVYVMTVDASSEWDIGGPGEGSYRAVFEITETILEERPEGHEVEVTMHPVEIEEDGLPSPGSADRTFTLVVGSSGEVEDVIDVDGIPATELDPDELGFIGTYRPPLPLEGVEVDDTWRSSQEVQLGQVFQQVTTTGRLMALAEDVSGMLASLSYEGGGPLVWTTTLPQGNAEMTGSADTTTDAIFEIDAGLLRSAESRTEGRFEVRVLPEDALPITGTLSLTLELSIERRRG